MNKSTFKSRIAIIGINPYVLVPGDVLENLFTQAGKDKGPIPVKGTLNKHPFTQTLVRYAGVWRLYLNGPMREAAGIDVGDMAHLSISYDDSERKTILHPELKRALEKNKKANAVFESLPPYLQKEIMRYINQLKTEESVNKNIKRAVQFLLGKEGFIGREPISY